MDNPEYLKIGDKIYKINTDFRNVLKLNKMSKDKSISDMERTIASIYLFYGEEGVNSNDYDKLIEGIYKFAKGRPNAMRTVNEEQQEIDMDYEKDMNLIIASMRSEYGIDITKEKIHWWTFFDYLNGLSSECILNRVRDIRTKDLSKINDREERETYRKLKEVWALDKSSEMTEEQKKSVDDFYKQFIS